MPREWQCGYDHALPSNSANPCPPPLNLLFICILIEKIRRRLGRDFTGAYFESSLYRSAFFIEPAARREQPA